jgi:hypothetical protein
MPTNPAIKTPFTPTNAAPFPASAVALAVALLILDPTLLVTLATSLLRLLYTLLNTLATVPVPASDAREEASLAMLLATDVTGATRDVWLPITVATDATADVASLKREDKSCAVATANRGRIRVEKCIFGYLLDWLELRGS